VIFLIIYILLGEFHFQIHVCHALYRLGGSLYLYLKIILFKNLNNIFFFLKLVILPFATNLGFHKLHINFPLKKWSQHDDFLLLFCDASLQWLAGMTN
jgi:hypothetical protein